MVKGPLDTLTEKTDYIAQRARKLPKRPFILTERVLAKQWLP